MLCEDTIPLPPSLPPHAPPPPLLLSTASSPIPHDLLDPIAPLGTNRHAPLLRREPRVLATHLLEPALRQPIAAQHRPRRRLYAARHPRGRAFHVPREFLRGARGRVGARVGGPVLGLGLGLVGVFV